MPEQGLFEWQPVRRVYSVAELNAAIAETLQARFHDVWIAGEISGARLAPSGHWYFTLKDRESQIKCACFRMSARYLKFKPQDGVLVTARGRVDVYGPRGEYQLLVEWLEPQGHGALQFAFEQLKQKLAAEGLFDSARKRPMPKLPWRIGLVTSPAGAVIQDMLQILARRMPGLHIRLYPAQVQGEGSVEAVCRGLRHFSQSEWAEVVIVARGGGSLEDLWTFNEEAVARAIAASSVPVISAIGHETDFTIADFVADLRAPTPSAAAELVVCTREQLLEQIAALSKSAGHRMRYRLSVEARRLHQLGVDRAAATLHRAVGRRLQRVDELDNCARDHVRRRLRAGRDRWQGLDARLRRLDLRVRFAGMHRRLDGADACLAREMRERLRSAQAGLEPLAGQLVQLSPMRILERGYAIVQDASGAVLRESSQAEVGEPLVVRLARGRLTVEVTAVD